MTEQPIDYIDRALYQGPYPVLRYAGGDKFPVRVTEETISEDERQVMQGGDDEQVEWDDVFDPLSNYEVPSSTYLTLSTSSAIHPIPWDQRPDD